MQQLGTLGKIANAASDVVEMARSSETYRFNVNGAVTFYLHAAHAEVRVVRWAEPRIEVEARLQAPFGWRIQTDQDEAGVYFVAFRRAVVGGLAGAVFTVTLPHTAYVSLKLDHGRLVLEDFTGDADIPATGGSDSDPTEPNLTDVKIGPLMVIASRVMMMCIFLIAQRRIAP